MILEAVCACGETFTPADEDDMVHLVRADGAECGRDGTLVGEWR